MNQTEIESLETLYKASCQYKEQVDLHIKTLVNAANACTQSMGNDLASTKHAARILAVVGQLQKSSKNLEALCGFVKKAIDKWYIVHSTT